MATIDLKNVVKDFDGTRAVDDVTLTVGEGEFLVILGPSGAGKTTTLKLVAGVEKVTSGSIVLDGREITKMSPRERDVAMAFESFSLYPHKNVFENIAFPLRAPGRKFSDAEIKERVEQVAELLAIPHLLDRMADQLSGGQKQRVALGRAVVREPKAFLMDEPLTHLDTRIRYRMRAELRRLAETIGVTSVYVTHDYVEALGLADRVVVLDRGRILQVGPPSEIFNDPATTRVASLVGQPSINLLPGEIVRSDGAGDLSFVSRGGTLTVPLGSEVPSGLTPGEEMLVGIRPQHVDVFSANGNSTAEVIAVEDQIVRAVLRVGNGDEELRVALHESVALVAGDKVGVRVDPAACLVFDPETKEIRGTLEGHR